jgi:NADH:ubiquinone oxidoreductase subunit 2 (subunit N)
MLASVVGAFVYLRIVVTMYGTDPDADALAEGDAAVDGPTTVVLGVAIAAILVLGILPGFALDFARDATLLLVGAR